MRVPIKCSGASGEVHSQGSKWERQAGKDNGTLLKEESKMVRSDTQESTQAAQWRMDCG